MWEEDFKRRLAALRVQKGVSARDMSLSIGQNPGYINSIETGNAMPSMSAFFFICDYLGVSPGEFFSTEIPYPEALKELLNHASRLNQEQLTALIVIARDLSSHNA